MCQWWKLQTNTKLHGMCDIKCMKGEMEDMVWGEWYKPAGLTHEPSSVWGCCCNRIFFLSSLRNPHPLLLCTHTHAHTALLSLSLTHTHTFYKNTQGQSSLLIEVLSTGSGEMGPSVQLTIFAALSTYDPSHCQLHLTGTIKTASPTTFSEISP